MLHLLASNRKYSRQNGPLRLLDQCAGVTCRFRSSRRINIGQKYQAEIPDLQDQLSSQFDQHKADLVWLPMDDSHLSPSDQQRSERLTLPAIRPPFVVLSYVSFLSPPS